MDNQSAFICFGAIFLNPSAGSFPPVPSREIVRAGERTGNGLAERQKIQISSRQPCPTCLVCGIADSTHLLLFYACDEPADLREIGVLTAYLRHLSSSCICKIKSAIFRRCPSSSALVNLAASRFGRKESGYEGEMSMRDKRLLR